MDRRKFIKKTAAFFLGGLVAGGAAKASAGHGPEASHDTLGMLVDTTLCIGCRQCELACDRVNKLTDPEKPEIEFADDSVFEKQRRPEPDAYTVVNRYPNPRDTNRPIYVKFQCMHCNHPACVSACIVGALHKEANGAVTWDEWKCMGCRYCMVACPFQVPAYEFHEALTPRVRKCHFCFERVTKEGKAPACAEACPMGVLTFGKRTELLELAHERILRSPQRYVSHIFGEHEVGGTSWLYLAGVPFDRLGFPKLGVEAPPAITERIQHSVFKYFLAPFSLYGLLGAVMWVFRSKDSDKEENG